MITVEQYFDPILENKLMVQIKQFKITAEVDGKQVPLENISTETFEAIKALKKPKEIPVARVGHYHGQPNDRRLFLKVTDSIRNNVADSPDVKMIAINLKNGLVRNSWTRDDIENFGALYEDIKPL